MATKKAATPAKPPAKTKNVQKPRASITESVKPKQKRKPRSPEKQILAEYDKKNKGGRPTKLTEEVETKIVAAVRGGNYIETAAAFAGIDKVTFYDWMKQGAAGKSPEMVKFSNSIKKALAESEVIPLSRIAEAGRSNWQAEAWRLERRFPERWAKKPEGQQVTIETDKDKGTTKVTLSDLYKQLNDNSEDI